MNWPGPMTHRQYEAWVQWESQAVNRPGITEHYLAQVCCEVARVLSSSPSKIKVSDFIMEFKLKDQQASAEHTRNVSNIGKGVWAGRTGMKATIVKPEDVKWVYPEGYTGPRYG